MYKDVQMTVLEAVQERPFEQILDMIKCWGLPRGVEVLGP